MGIAPKTDLIHDQPSTGPPAHIGGRRPGSERITIIRPLAQSVAVAVATAAAVSACTSSVAGHRSVSVSVFSARAGQCFVSPTTVHAELSKLSRTPCSQKHNQEAYATVGYVAADGSKPSTYPGNDLLTKFAQGACAPRFGPYVGVDYLDSSLYFTYLLPSPRSWQADDRNVICFITTACGTLESSVKGSKK